MSKNILIITAMDFTDQVYEGLQRLKEEGCRFTLMSDMSFKPRAGFFEDYWIFDICSTLAAIEFVQSKGIAFDAVVTQSCELVTPLVALLNREFGGPGNTPETAFYCRSKYHMRSRLKAAGIPQPDFRLCRSRPEIEQALFEIGLPCVVKPVGGHSSFGTFMVQDETDAVKAGEEYERCRNYLEQQSRLELKQMADFSAEELELIGIKDPVNMVTDFLVEGFMNGPEISVDSLTQNGETTLMGVVEQVRMEPPYFVEVSETTPYQGSAENLKAIENLIRQTVKAMGITDSASHTEIMMTSEGPKIVEIACRIGSDNIHDAVYQTTGYHLLEEAVRIALGEPRKYTVMPRCHYAMEYLLPEKEGIFKEVRVPESVKKSPFITEYRIDAKAGERVGPPPKSFDFLGYVGATGATPKEARQYLKDAISKMEVIYE